MKTIFKCQSCNEFMPECQILMPSLPPHPKTGERETVNQCPFCGCVEDFVNICDEKGCRSVAGCGWVSVDGYRRTCGDHYRSAV